MMTMMVISECVALFEVGVYGCRGFRRPPVNVPSYGHLLNRSRMSSDSDDANADATKKKSDDQNQPKGSKRALTLSPAADISPIKKKKPKRVLKQRAALSMSSSDNDSANESVRPWTLRPSLAPTLFSLDFHGWR